jgi:hypothetical protein
VEKFGLTVHKTGSPPKESTARSAGRIHSLFPLILPVNKMTEVESMSTEVFLLRRRVKELQKTHTRDMDMINMLVNVLEKHDIKWWEEMLEE